MSVTLGTSSDSSMVGSVIGAFDATSVTPGSPYLRVNIVQDAEGMRFTVIHLADDDMDFDVDVPGLFSFLSAWFSGTADFEGDGSSTIPDIFAFLSAWFSTHCERPRIGSCLLPDDQAPRAG